MTDRILGFNYRMSSWKLFLVLFALFLVFGWLQESLPIGLDHLPEISEGIQPLDTDTYRAEDVYPRLESLPSEAASYYQRVLLTTDFFFPVLFRLMLIVLATLFVKVYAAKGSRLFLLTLVPLSSMLADILENSSIVLIIEALPAKLLFLPTAVSFLTRYKWISNYVEWAVIALLGCFSLLSLMQRALGRSE
jgi:hypothetical protein